MRIVKHFAHGTSTLGYTEHVQWDLMKFPAKGSMHKELLANLLFCPFSDPMFRRKTCVFLTWTGENQRVTESYFEPYHNLWHVNFIVLKWFCDHPTGTTSKRQMKMQKYCGTHCIILPLNYFLCRPCTGTVQGPHRTCTVLHVPAPGLSSHKC